MSTIDQEKAFDELTETIRKAAYSIEKCSCCEEAAVDHLKVFLCDKHMKKYSDIKGYE